MDVFDRSVCRDEALVIADTGAIVTDSMRRKIGPGPEVMRNHLNNLSFGPVRHGWLQDAIQASSEESLFLGLPGVRIDF